MFRELFGKIHPSVFLKAAKAAETSISEHEQRLVELCQPVSEEALRRLGVGENGLSAEAVEEALRQYGPNVLSHSKKTGVVVEILQRCKNPLVIQLLVICAVSLMMGDVRSATVVGAMIVLSVVLAHVQEHRSSKAVEKLHAMVETTCLVVRDGKECDVHMAEIVPGDIVVLQAGAIVPADLRLISAKDFFVSQSSLTGESMPVEKHAGLSETAGRGIIDLQNACFQGSTVLSGTAAGWLLIRGAPLTSVPSRKSFPGNGFRPVLIVE